MLLIKMRIVCIGFLMMCVINESFAQNSSVKGMDDELSMEIRRSAEGVNVIVSFTSIAKYATVVIEYGRWEDAAYRECAIIDLMEVNDNGAFETTVERPLSPFYDYHFRIKTITSDNQITIHGPVKLPASLQLALSAAKK